MDPTDRTQTAGVTPQRPPDAPSTRPLYALPRTITDLADCFFYHSVDIPGHGHVDGVFDLREGVHKYLGGVDVRGKRVLEIGAASGFLSFHMERQGAEVVAYDLSDEHDWDVVPYSQYRHQDFAAERRAHIGKLNNSFWLCHRAFQSSVRMVHGTVYTVPAEIGPVDVATFSAVLLHVRDPFRALEQALRLTRETAIVTECFKDDRTWHYTMPPLGRLERLLRLIRRKCVGRSDESAIVFLPDSHRSYPKETWWYLTPAFVQRSLGVLGFEETSVTYHYQKCRTDDRYRELPMYTVVGRRTRAIEPV
jgi:hypothetical protein